MQVSYLRKSATSADEIFPPMFLTHLRCTACGLEHDWSRLQNLCTVCGKPLFTDTISPRLRARHA